MKFELRILLNWFLLTIASLSLTACGQSSDCFREDVFCAGLVTDTQGINDHGINQDTWAGLEASRSGGVLDRAEYIESVDVRDYKKNIDYFAAQGYDVIITTGAGLSDETLLSADLHPDSVFVGINQPREESRPNLISVAFAEDQMGFAAGALAVRLSEVRVVGAACETADLPAMWRYCEGFRAGAMFTSKLLGVDVKVLVSYRKDTSSEDLFLKEAWGLEAGQDLIQSGADVIFAAGGLTGQGALRAAGQAGVRAIGAERDQGASLAESGSSVATSIYGGASFEVQNVMRLLKEGNAPDVVPGRLWYVPFNQKFPESLSGEMDALLLALWSGEIKTGVAPEMP